MGMLGVEVLKTKLSLNTISLNVREISSVSSRR